MGLLIIKPGVFDTVQDAGRYGYQHWGINPGGAADNISHSTANMLVGNNPGEAVMELHYPAATIQFRQHALVALCGGNFTANINGIALPLDTPVIIKQQCTVTFSKLAAGHRCYLAVAGGFDVDTWLGSCSANIKSGAPGFAGNKLKAGDLLPFKRNDVDYPAFGGVSGFYPLPWHTAPLVTGKKEKITLHVCYGNEYPLLCGASKDILASTSFTVTKDSDRMGCRLSGIPLQVNMQEGLVSSGVTAGTLQLLPSGQVVILGAEHQSTGGYPRIAHVISADRHLIGQLQPGDIIDFEIVDIVQAELLLLQQHQYLQQLQAACFLQLENFFASHGLH
ncbi:MAG TPA: biotin-dependent carboxyltransferase family protein [Chitinophagaceae bacterium]|nr:biotin-dependent carboxyltransferase family protein [Chitinophagaceae bacterium]